MHGGSCFTLVAHIYPFINLYVPFSSPSNGQTHFHQCTGHFPDIGCEMFTNHMARSASTISLSILVVIEMLNACNALSQSESLVTLPVWKNMKLVYAIILSMILHFGILYVPGLQALFQVSPLNMEEWKGVIGISIPIMYFPSQGRNVLSDWLVSLMKH